MLATLPLIGAVGFMLIEGWGFFDSFYMAVITLTTVGFREVHELGRAGQLFVVGYLVLGLGTFFYGIVQLGERIVRMELGTWFERRKMDSALKGMKNHVIVCGFGRMGRTVCRNLAEKELPFVAIDRNRDALEDCQKLGWVWLLGDATDDEVLVEAGIERARGLASVLDEDADNVYVVLSARILAKTLPIMARASDEKSMAKLKKAGADRVVSLYEAGASKMAELISNPKIEDYAEIDSGEARELDLAEFQVDAQSPYSGRTLAETGLRKRGIVIVGIKRKNGELLLPPKESARIEIDDALIVLGKADAIAKLLARA